MSAGPIEQKSAAATTTAFIVGYLAAIAVTAIPWLHDHLTPDQRQQLPAVVTAAFVALAAYYAPHTHRADLVPPPAPLPVTGDTADEILSAPPAGGSAHAGE